VERDVDVLVIMGSINPDIFAFDGLTIHVGSLDTLFQTIEGNAINTKKRSYLPIKEPRKRGGSDLIDSLLDELEKERETTPLENILKGFPKRTQG
jgi:hypothetical protein